MGVGCVAGVFVVVGSLTEMSRDEPGDLLRCVDRQRSSDVVEEGITQDVGDPPQRYGAALESGSQRGGSRISWATSSISSARMGCANSQLCQQPTSCQGPRLGGQPIQAKKAFETLERQLDLPAHPVGRQDLGRGPRCWQRGQHHPEPGRLSRQRVQGRPGATLAVAAATAAVDPQTADGRRQTIRCASNSGWPRCLVPWPVFSTVTGCSTTPPGGKPANNAGHTRIVPSATRRRS